MRALARQNNEAITLNINSIGGSIYGGLAIFDTMRDLMSQGIIVKTLASCLAASMGSFLLSAGSPGHRTMLPNAREMTHQPSQGVDAPNEDEAQNHAKKLTEARDIVESHYAHFMGLDDKNPKTRKLIKKYMSEDVYLNAYMAQRLGLVDHIAMQENGKPAKSIKDEFLRKSIEIDIRLNKRQFDNIDTSPESTDPRRHVKRLIRHRNNYLSAHKPTKKASKALKIQPDPAAP
jgi:ATP-dependent Clp protease protease subunit